MRGWAQLPRHAAHVCSVSRDYTWPSVCKLCRNFANSYCALLWCLELSKYHLVVRFALHFVSFHPWLKVCVLGLWSEVVTLLDSSASSHLSFPIADRSEPNITAVFPAPPQSSLQGNCSFNYFHAVTRHFLIFSHQEYFVLPSPPHILDCVMFWPGQWVGGGCSFGQTLSDSVWATQRRRGQTFPADWPCPGWSLFWTNVNKDILLGKNKLALSDHSISTRSFRAKESTNFYSNPVLSDH